MASTYGVRDLAVALFSTMAMFRTPDHPSTCSYDFAYGWQLNDLLLRNKWVLTKLFPPLDDLLFFLFSPSFLNALQTFLLVTC